MNTPSASCSIATNAKMARLYPRLRFTRVSPELLALKLVQRRFNISPNIKQKRQKQ